MTGVLNCGYLAYAALSSLSDNQGPARTNPTQAGHRRRAAARAQLLVLTALQCAVVLAPFLAFQAFGYAQFCCCRAGEHAAERVTPAHTATASYSTGSSPLSGGTCVSRPAWCSARLPYLYGRVQSAYWGVGFLRSYRSSEARASQEGAWCSRA